MPEWPPDTVVILSTAAGRPHAIPVSTGVRAGSRVALFALAAGRESLRRLRADPRVALTLLCEGDVAVTAYGTARVIEEPLPGIDGVVAVAVDVEEVADHSQPRFVIEAGVQWRWVDPQAQSRDADVRAALAQLAQRYTQRDRD
ncbi:MAG: pyridoxamine 5'-phosphate oxidase family protein [Egibacteraceae bacterium]